MSASGGTLDRLREIRPFASADELVNQVHRDVLEANDVGCCYLNAECGMRNAE